VSGTVFYKMNGSGNDFVMVDGRDTTADHWPAERIRAICDRRRGVGADGLVILAPSTPEAVRMTYWNSDGSRGAMCGNAALCCGWLATHLELVAPGEFCLLTDAGPVRVRSQQSSETAEINLPNFEIGLPIVFRSRGGPELRVRADLAAGRASNVWLAGQGKLVFRGVWESPVVNFGSRL
jgi:diaminopimelate epimerase